MSGGAPQLGDGAATVEPAARSLIGSIKTILLATLLSGLIWFWAEGESLTSSSVTLRVALPAEPAGDLLLRAGGAGGSGGDWPATVSVRLQGSTLAVSAAAALASETLTLSPQLRAMPSAPGENQVVSLRDALAEMPELKKRGLMVTDAEPRSLLVSATRLASRTLPVRVVGGGDALVDRDAQVRPGVVEVRFPEAAASTVEALEAVSAVIPPEDAARLRPDMPQSLVLTLRPPVELEAYSDVRFNPPTVQVSLRARRTTDDYTLTGVPVYVGLPPGRSGAWEVDVAEPALGGIVVSGGPGSIDRLRAGTIPVSAIVVLSEEEFARLAKEAGGSEERFVTRKASLIGLPADVTLTGEPPAVRLRVIPRVKPVSDGGAVEPVSPAGGEASE